MWQMIVFIVDHLLIDWLIDWLIDRSGVCWLNVGKHRSVFHLWRKQETFSELTSELCSDHQTCWWLNYWLTLDRLIDGSVSCPPLVDLIGGCFRAAADVRVTSSKQSVSFEHIGDDVSRSVINISELISTHQLTLRYSRFTSRRRRGGRAVTLMFSWSDVQNRMDKNPGRLQSQVSVWWVTDVTWLWDVVQ